MKKKILITILVAATVAVAYWLISPLWRELVLDEPVPRDALDTMDDATRAEFERQVDAMSGDVMDRNESVTNTPDILREGEMVARAHEVEGRALAIDTGSMRFLRFEDLDTVNGPDLRIYLASDLSADDVIDLGAVRATRGNVNYAIPPGTDLEHYRYAMIWCRAFSVLFSYAELQ
ncbi:MAG TPA: DM13 domain-containing protein [Candidatus Paceibacterota bacterium]|nr:DM13 domain-containing protein [Candidatus Paceibacterota bacterium]